jgi:large subunit ribosomal protein L21
VELGEVLLVDTGEKLLVGTPYVPGAKVQARVLRHLRGRKIDGFKYKPKKNYRRRWGHRQSLTELKIENIIFKE